MPLFEYIDNYYFYYYYFYDVSLITLFFLF